MAIRLASCPTTSSPESSRYTAEGMTGELPNSSGRWLPSGRRITATVLKVPKSIPTAYPWYRCWGVVCMSGYLFSVSRGGGRLRRAQRHRRRVPRGLVPAVAGTADKRLDRVGGADDPPILVLYHL